MIPVMAGQPGLASARYTVPRDVIVVGLVGLADTIADALRRSGLSVGTFLLHDEAAASGARRHARSARPANRTRPVEAWRRALVVSLFAGDLSVAAEIEAAVAAGLPEIPPAWIQLSPRSMSTPAADVVIRAPLEVRLRDKRLYTTPSTRGALDAALLSGLPAPAEAILQTLIRAIPAQPTIDL